MEKLQNYRNELADLDIELAKPNAFNDPKIGEKTRRQSELQHIIELLEELDLNNRNKESALEMVSEGGELKELAESELLALNSNIEELSTKIQEILTPKDPNNNKNVIVFFFYSESKFRVAMTIKIYFK